MKPLDSTRTGFDFDDVMTDTVAAFLRMAREDYGLRGCRFEDITEFNPKPLPGAREIQDEILDAVNRNPLATGVRPAPGALGVIARLSANHPVTIVTARPDPAPVEEWLAYYLGVHAGNVRVLHTGGDHDDKLRHIRAAGLTAFIDDRAETCVALAAAGIDARVYEKPWNRGRHALPTVRNWDDIAKILFVE